ncbi:MAG TPA: dockerin type I domain-containing protein [Phycisphaerae bacterium]|nr:dockerin type I domain-containing protein [Phycisphaerae bacterium]HRY68942.1 dockerin type I domain-containing protein [Phycisphaerae bacterium]HSA25769.1 dockerin type I domain-containing protein [Phycisphaerae bacterium]
MADRNGPSFDTGDPEVPPELAGDLRGLFGTAPRVPPLVDEDVRVAARRVMAGQRRRRWVVRAVSIGAAAACVAGILWIGGLIERPGRETALPGGRLVTVAQADREDVNGDGRVDILDALTLARGIDRGVPGQAAWDMNRDGVLDRGDVDLVAYRAVRLTN